MTNLESYTYVSIGGVDVSSYVMSWSLPETISQIIDELNLLLVKTVLDVVTLVNETEVIVKRGKTTDPDEMDFYFRGFIVVWSPKGVNFEIIAQNKLRQLKRRQVSYNYIASEDPTAGVLSAIVEDLVETWGELTANVTDSSTYSTAMQVYPCNNDYVFERVDTLRQVLNWVLRYDYENDTVILEPKGTYTATTILRYNKLGTTNILEPPKWDNDSTNMVNAVTIMGKATEGAKTDLFSGDGVTTVFTLSRTPNSIEVQVGGVQKTLGQGGSGGAYDFSVEQYNNTITFNSTSIPAVGVNNIQVDYMSFVPPTAIREDSDSIDVYGKSQDTFVFQDCVTNQDCEKRAIEVLERFGQPFGKSSFPIPHFDEILHAGMNIPVADDENDVHGLFVITEIMHQWPDPVDIISLGQERIFEQNTAQSTEDRLQKLEKREYQNVTQVNTVKDANITARATVYGGALTRDVSFDGAWGKGFGDGTTRSNYTWGEVGAKWQGSYTNSTALWAVVWPDDLYEEDFLDDYFVDTGNTSATVDTTNGRVTF